MSASRAVIRGLNDVDSQSGLPIQRESEEVQRW